jgi:cytoskeletal protein CcmA (bactofilin family)
MSNLAFKRTLITLATVSCATLSATDADAATGASTGALGGGVVTVGSVGTNQIDGTADFSIDAGDTLVILGTDPVSGGGNTFGHKITFADGATIQLDNDLIVNGDGTDAIDILGAATIYTNTGDLTLNDRVNNSGDPVSLVKTGAGTLTLENNTANFFPNDPAAPPNLGVDAPEFDFQEGTIVNDIHSATNNNNHFRIGDNTSLVGGGVRLKTSVPTLSTLEVGNNNTIASDVRAADLIMGDGNTIEDFVELRGVYGLTSVIGANNTFADNILFNTNGNSLTIGGGNNFKKSIITLPAPGDGTIRFSPGTTASRLGQDQVINTELSLATILSTGSDRGIHIEGPVEIAGGCVHIFDSYARLYSTGSLTFTDPSIEFNLRDNSIFQLDQDYTFNNPITLSGGGNTLRLASGTTTTINVNVTGAGEDLIIEDSGTLVLNASVPQHLDMTSGGNLTLGAAGSVPGNVSGNNAADQVFTIAGSIAGTLNTGNGNNTVSVASGGTLGGLTTGSGNNLISIDGTLSGNIDVGGSSQVSVGGQVTGNVTLNSSASLNVLANSDIQGTVTANSNSTITLYGSPTGTVTMVNGNLVIPSSTTITSNVTYSGAGGLTLEDNATMAGDITFNAPGLVLSIGPQGNLQSQLANAKVSLGSNARITGGLFFNQDVVLEKSLIAKVGIAAGKTMTLRDSSMLDPAEVIPTADASTQIILDNTKVDMNTTTWTNSLSKMVLQNDATLFASGGDNLSNVSIDNFSQNSLDLVTLNTTMSPSTAALTIASYNAYDPGNEGTLVVGIDTLAGSRSQWLSVVGNANITDSKLIVVANRDSTFNSYSDSYDVIEYGGVRIGSFATLELQNSEREVASGLTAAADYSNAGKVRISLAKLSNYADSLGANTNQSAQIAALDASSNAFLNQLDWDVRMASSDNARLILDQVSAEGYQMLYQNDRNQAQNFNQAMFERSRQRLFERERPYHSTWITPSWNYARADNHASYYGHEIKASGIDFGFDRKHKRYRMLSGLALGFRDSSSQSKLNLKDSGKHYHLGWYLHALSGPDHFMNLQASLSYNQHDSKRDISAGDYTGRLTSDNNSYVLAADAKLGTHVFDNWGHSYTPYLALSTIYQDGDNIVESSNDTNAQNLALSVDKHNRWHGYIGLGSDMRLTRKNALIYNFHVKPVVSLEYLTEFSNNANKALDTAFSIDPDNQFAIRGIHVGRHTGSLGFSLEGLGLSKRTKGHFFNAGYNAKVRSQGNVQHAFNINYQWKW